MILPFSRTNRGVGVHSQADIQAHLKCKMTTGNVHYLSHNWKKCMYNFFCPFFILERRRSANTNWHIRCEVFMELSKAADLSWVRGAQLSSLYYYYHLLFSKFGNVIFDTWKFWFSFAYSMVKIKCNLLLFKVGNWTFKCVIV